MSTKIYLEPNSITVTWAEARTVTIGHHPCGNCGVDSPGPTSDQLLAFAQRMPHGGSLWPGAGHNAETYLPASWTYDYDLGLLCSTCTAAKRAALDALKSKR